MDTTETRPVVRVHCLTPDFADGLYNRLRDSGLRPLAVAGPVVVVATDGTEAGVAALQDFVRAIGVALPSGVQVPAAVAA